MLFGHGTQGPEGIRFLRICQKGILLRYSISLILSTFRFYLIVNCSLDMIMNAKAMSISISNCCTLSKFGRKKLHLIPLLLLSFEHKRISHPVKTSHNLKHIEFSSYLHTHVNTNNDLELQLFRNSMVRDPLGMIMLIIRVIVASSIFQKAISAREKRHEEIMIGIILYSTVTFI